MADVDRTLADLVTWWDRAAHSDLVAAQKQVAALHDLARRVEDHAGWRSGRLLREAADLVADAAVELRLARRPEGL